MTSRTSSRPLRADAARNRALVLRAAQEVFADHGLEVSLEDIARHAGVGIGTLYRRFTDRESLIDALFEERVQEQVARAHLALEEPDPWRALVELLRDVCRQLAGDRGMRQVMLSSEYGLDRVARGRDQMLPLVSELVERAKAVGALRADFSPTDIPLLFLMVGTVADFGGAASPELWSRYFSVFVDGLRADAAQHPLDVAALDLDQMNEAMGVWRPGGGR